MSVMRLLMSWQPSIVESIYCVTSSWVALVWAREVAVDQLPRPRGRSMGTGEPIILERASTTLPSWNIASRTEETIILVRDEECLCCKSYNRQRTSALRSRVIVAGVGFLPPRRLPSFSSSACSAAATCCQSWPYSRSSCLSRTCRTPPSGGCGTPPRYQVGFTECKL